MKYYCWVDDDTDDSLTAINKLPDELEEHYWKLTHGVSSTDWFPDTVEFQLDPNYGVKIPDSIPNSYLLKIVSEKLKGILQESSESFEFYPIKLRNAKGKLSTKKFYVANLINTISAIDSKKSQVRESKLDTTQVDAIKKLVLDKKKIPEETAIFRLSESPDIYITTKEMAINIKRTNSCNGLFFIPEDEYNSIDY